MSLESFPNSYFSHVFIDIGKIKSIIRSSGNSFLIGLTGGIASGKTTVAEKFREYGAEIIDFDVLAREVVAPGSQGLADIASCFGHGILDINGSLDRKALSHIVFQNIDKRRELERLIHPAIFELFCKQVKQIACEKSKTACDNSKCDNAKRIIIAVIPLLVEMNLQTLFDKIIVVYISSEIQLQRLIKRERLNTQKAGQMIKSQLPIDQKTKYADYLIDNSNDLKKTFRQVKDVWEKL